MSEAILLQIAISAVMAAFTVFFVLSGIVSGYICIGSFRRGGRICGIPIRLASSGSHAEPTGEKHSDRKADRERKSS